MASVVADRLSGGDRRFEGADTSTKLKLLGVDVAAFGTSAPADDRVEFSDPETKIHRRVSTVAGRVTGGVLIGDISNYDVLHAMATGVMASEQVGSLVLPAAAGGGGDGGGVALPDDALLCTCNTVTRGACRKAVAEESTGSTTLWPEPPPVRPAAAASPTSPGCSTPNSMPWVSRRNGRCAPTLRPQQAGAVRPDPVSPPHRLAPGRRSHGSGRGCEICRPAVASILASLSNGHILDGDQASLQDTNDRSLANMQRNGTYSVVPRVPGGEITRPS